MLFTLAYLLGFVASVIARPAPSPVAQQGEGPCWIVPDNDDPNALSTQIPCYKPEPRPYSSITPMDPSTTSVDFDPNPSPNWVPAIAPTPTSSTWVDATFTPYTPSPTDEYGVETGAMGGIGGANFPTPYPTLSTTGSGWGGIGGSMNPWTAAATSYTYSSIMPPWGSSSSDYGYSSSTSYLNNGAGWGRPTESTYQNGWGAPPTSTYNNGAGWGRPTDSTYNNGAGWGRPTDSTYTTGWSSSTSAYNGGSGWGPPPPDSPSRSWGESGGTPLPTWAGGQSGWDNQPSRGGLGGALAPASTCRRNWLGRCT